MSPDGSVSAVVIATSTLAAVVFVGLLIFLAWWYHARRQCHAAVGHGSDALFQNQRVDSVLVTADNIKRMEQQRSVASSERGGAMSVDHRISQDTAIPAASAIHAASIKAVADRQPPAPPSIVSVSAMSNIYGAASQAPRYTFHGKQLGAAHAREPLHRDPPLTQFRVLLIPDSGAFEHPMQQNAALNQANVELLSQSYPPRSMAGSILSLSRQTSLESIGITGGGAALPLSEYARSHQSSSMQATNSERHIQARVDRPPILWRASGDAVHLQSITSQAGNASATAPRRRSMSSPLAASMQSSPVPARMNLPQVREAWNDE